MFRRRNPIPLIERIRDWVWPRNGWRRASQYVVARLKRMPGTPHGIAAGLAAGVVVSFTPLFPHLASAALLAMLVRGSVVAAWAGTLVGNPSTFPFIWFASYNLGLMLMGREPVSDHVFAIQSGLHQLPDPFTLAWAQGWIEQTYEWAKVKFVPMLIGGVPLGLLAGIACYLPLVRVIAAFQAARRRRQSRGQAKGAKRDGGREDANAVS